MKSTSKMWWSQYGKLETIVITSDLKQKNAWYFCTVLYAKLSRDMENPTIIWYLSLASSGEIGITKRSHSLASDPVVIKIDQLIVKKEKGKNLQHNIDLFLYAYFCNLNISIILELKFNFHNFQIYVYSSGLSDFLCILNLYLRACPFGRVYSR